MFCTKCGTNLPDDAAFCTSCGTPIKTAAPAQAATPVAPAQEVPPVAPVMGAPVMGAPVMSAPVQIVPAGKNIRFKCPACQTVADVTNDAGCSKCGAPNVPGGYIKMYRMGSAYGVAMPFGIYIDNEPCGYIGNKQTCWIRVPYGTHRVHIAAAANRKCDDVMITILPEHPLEAIKVYMKPGFWTNSFHVISANPSEVPD